MKIHHHHHHHHFVPLFVSLILLCVCSGKNWLSQTVKQDRDTKVMTQTIQQTAETARVVLPMTNHEATTYILKQLTTIKDELAQAKVEYDLLLTELLLVRSSNAKTLHTIDSFCFQELEQCRSLHSNRSYCNMTHFTSDVYDASANAYSQTLKTAKETAMTVYTESRKYAGLAIEIAIGHVSNGLVYSKRFINDQMDELWPKIQPYYKEHITDNYEKAIERAIEHVSNGLENSKRFINDLYDARVSPLVQKLAQDGKEIHQTMLDLYGEYCQSSIEAFRKASKEVDVLTKNQPPMYLMVLWEKSCAHPQESLNALMQGTLLLFTILRILGLICWVIKSLISILCFTPRRKIV
jgi:hypothetical protein